MRDNTAHTPSRCHVVAARSVLLGVEPCRALQGGLEKLPKKKRAHPTLQALVKIDLAANTNSSTHSGRFGLRRCPRRNGYANEQGRIEHSCDCQGYVFLLGHLTTLCLANSCVRLRGCMTRTTGPCYCDGMFLRGFQALVCATHSFVCIVCEAGNDILSCFC